MRKGSRKSPYLRPQGQVAMEKTEDPSLLESIELVTCVCTLEIHRKGSVTKWNYATQRNKRMSE
jgi:hypothetical protein